MARKTRNNSSPKSFKNGKHAHDTSKDTASIGILKNQHVWITVLLFLVASVLHFMHTTTMFESDKHFSHLSTLERELSFRTEMGLYYSYYKTIIEAPTFFSGIYEITHDNITEYPSVINTLQRFNLYPEVVTAFLYRNFRWFTDTMDVTTQQCWQTNRGEGQSPVVSCEGLGDPMYFYVSNVYLLNAAMMGGMYLYGASLSGSYLGGVLAVIAYFYNHGECTRVQWTPALRESFAYPFLLLQMLITSTILRQKRPCNWFMMSNAALSLVSILFWQFAPFALTTQVVAVTVVYSIDLIHRDIFKSFLKGQLLALLASYLFLFGNRMLLCSFMTTSIIAAFVLMYSEQVMSRIRLRLLRWIFNVIHFLLMTLCFKIVLTKLMSLEDDAHIMDILKSKFTNFSTFHTKLYTCAVEFDFLPLSTYWLLCQSLLLPAALAGVVALLYQILKYMHSASPVDPAMVYNLLQLIAYAIMAALIMRLKLFFTPQLCLFVSLLACKKLFPVLRSDQLRVGLLVLLVAGMTVKGYENLKTQWNIKGEFSHPTLEEMMLWVNETTDTNSVFAGSMPIMATVKLTTKRPIVNHPHYEDVALRARTKKVYTLFSRKPLRDVYQHLVDLEVDYVIIDRQWCVGRSGSGCALAEIWDREDEEYVGRSPACSEMLKNPKPYFTAVRANNMFELYKVNKFPQGKGDKSG